MATDIGESPIINSAYFPPKKHWVMDRCGRFTGEMSFTRRPSEYLLPYPASDKQIEADNNLLPLGEMREYPMINEIRNEVNKWKHNTAQHAHISYVTRRLLEHWNSNLIHPKPFFCQLEAIETIIWLNDVAPSTSKGKKILSQLDTDNADYNHGLNRIATKMATGSGKTTVMAMIIAYNCINKARFPASDKYSKNFIVVTPGLTINRRLEELQPNAQNSIYLDRNLVPPEFLSDIVKARVVIFNFHVFRNKERSQLTKLENLYLGKSEDHKTIESDRDMVFNLTKPLLGSNAIVLNDEAHHCYSTKGDAITLRKRSEEMIETRGQLESARMWMRGIQLLKKHKFKKLKVHDLSATPFFLAGSGYESGVLFPWVVSDFGLIDAIECGITKLPRIPTNDDSITDDNLPIFRNLYSHVKDALPRKGRRKLIIDHVNQLPATLTAAIDALYAHYVKTSEKWKENKTIQVPPVMIIVCNNTATSKLVFEYVAGRKKGTGEWEPGACGLLSNVTDDGKIKNHLNSILIDSNQLESGSSLSSEYINAVKDSLQQFGTIKKTKFGEILRDMLNSVGKPDAIGSRVRCVVSVSMLSEGWDAKNVTHILGVRAFGSDLLCEQVVGRGLRRYAFDVDPNDEKALLSQQYAEIIGIPFTFATGTSQATPDSPCNPTRIHAVKGREHLEITFPRVISYQHQLHGDKIFADFNEDSYFPLSPNDIPTSTELSGSGGEGTTLSIEHFKSRRIQEVEYEIANAVNSLFMRANDGHNSLLFWDLLKITRIWLDQYLVCKGDVPPQYLLYKPFANDAAQIIFNACTRHDASDVIALPILDQNKQSGSSKDVNFETTKKKIRVADRTKSHVNKIVCDSGWEEEISILLEKNTCIDRYVRNEGLDFKIPYWYNKILHDYCPDFIAVTNSSSIVPDINLIIEVKGMRTDKDRAKADTARSKWVKAVNDVMLYGIWDFIEVTNTAQFTTLLTECLDKHRENRRVLT